MPAIRRFHQSEFRIDGYVHRISITSKTSPSSSQTPILAPETIRSQLYGQSQIDTGNYHTFHQSVFSIVLERNVSLTSRVIPTPNALLGVGIPVSLYSIAQPQSSIRMNINSTISLSKLNPKSLITAKYVVPNSYKILFGDFEFEYARRTRHDKIVPLTNSKMSNAGIDEPRAYTRTIAIVAKSENRLNYDEFMKLMGKKLVLSVYGVQYENAYISNISDLQRKPNLNLWLWDVEFTQHVFDTRDTAQWGNIQLSNPTVPNPFDISPSYSVDMSSGIDLSNSIPRVSEHYALECLTESPAEHAALRQAIGTKQTLIVNGKSYPLCYISTFSYLQPRGGGNVYGYTIEFTRELGVNPVSVTFDGIVLPNCTYAGNSELEIIQSRTLLHSGKTAVDIGSYTSRRFVFSCMSNSKTAYTQLLAKNAQKKTLIVDGETFTKMYISEWSDARVIGDGATRIYQWQIGFDQETV